MQEKGLDLLHDLKKWVLDAPEGVRIMRQYNQGYISLNEAVRLVSASYMDEIRLINISR